MKLFVMTSRIPYPLEKGDKLRIFHQMKVLSQKHEVYLCALQSPSNKENEKAKTELMKFCKEVHFIKLSPFQIIKSLITSLFTGLPFQSALFTDDTAKNKVRELINSINPDHIYCQLTRVAEYVRHENLPKTLDYMDAFSKGMERRAQKASIFSSWIYKWEARRQRKYENLVFTDFTNHSIITEEDQNCIDTPNKKDIKIVRNGVDFNFFKPISKSIKYDIVFVGNMAYAPNIDAAHFLCNEILPLIKKVKPDVNILLAGAEPSTSVLNLQSNSVKVSGWIDDIRDAYAESTIFIAPMRIGTGLQNKLLEAMAMQKACVTTPLANKALKAQNNAILVGETAQELANHCIHLLNKVNEREELAKSGHQFVKEEYQWNKTTELLTHLFI